MKILKKNLMTQTDVKPSKPTKTIEINIVKWILSVGVTLSIIVGLVLLWPCISKFSNEFAKGFSYQTTGWTSKTETKTYPVSHIRIEKENEYYDANQLNAGYALVNYKILKDKGDNIALDVIKKTALEGNGSRSRYEFTIDDVDYDSVDMTSRKELFITPRTNVFDKVEYKKGLDMPQVKVYYKLKYHHGKFENKTMKYETTLILPD